MKKVLFAIISAMALLTACGGAHAQTVVGVDGVKVLGADSLLAVAKEPTQACGATYCAKALYGSGWQYLADDAAHSKYGKLVAQCGAACLTVDGATDGLAVAVGRSNGVYCVSGKSLIAFPNSGNSLDVVDSCTFWAKVKANSQ